MQVTEAVRERSLRGVNRCVDALERHGFRLPMLHAIGRRDRMGRAAASLDEFGVVQYCLRSTKTPHTRDWIDLWRQAKVVWSYYDLYALCREDGTPTDFNFYHAPLGVTDAFVPHGVAKRYLICTNGTYMTESVREAVIAAAGRPVMHLGEDVDQPNVDYVTGVSDDELARLYSACSYVSGLRRVEGFELPAAEGLCCGARPILFDRPHYRRWYDNWAVFITEASREWVVASLRRIFDGTPSVTPDEIAAARRRFDWAKIIQGLEEAAA